MAVTTKLAKVCAALNARGAKYVVVGAQAVNLWGVTRGTRDIDILIEATAENAQKVLAALADLGFILVRDLDPQQVAGSPVTVIGDLYNVDVFTLAWSVRYPEASAESRDFTVEEVTVPTVSIRHLIASKRTGRLQDAADIELLEEIARRRPA